MHVISSVLGCNLSSLAVDAEGQMARFVGRTLRVCSGLVDLHTGPEDRVCFFFCLFFFGEVSFNNKFKC